MPLEAAAARFLKRLNAVAPQGFDQPSLDDLRGNLRALTAFAGTAPAVSRVDETLAAGAKRLPIRIYASQSGHWSDAPGLIYFHGGGLVAGDLDTHDALCATLAKAASCVVIAVDYGLAPENVFPGPFDDALDAAEAILGAPGRYGLDPKRIAVGGDSAGGALAVHVARSLRERAPGLIGLALLCPALNVEPSSPSRMDLARGHLLQEATLAAYWRLIRIDGVATDDERLSPALRAEVAGLPPTLLHVAEFDPLRDEGEVFGRRLKSAGVKVSLRRHAGLIHHFYGLGGAIPAAREALAVFCADLAAMLRAGP